MHAVTIENENPKQEEKCRKSVRKEGVKMVMFGKKSGNHGKMRKKVKHTKTCKKGVDSWMG